MTLSAASPAPASKSRKAKEKELNPAVPGQTRNLSQTKSRLAILAVTGITLAAVAVAGTVGFIHEQSPAKANASSIQLIAHRPVPHTHYLTYYIVDSEAQRQLVFNGEQEAARERGEDGSVPPAVEYRGTQFANPLDEAYFASEMNFLREQNTDPQITIVDLRGR